MDKEIPYFLTQDHMPEAQWLMGGALRFDRVFMLLHLILKNEIKVRRVEQLAGVMPCLWSLSWYEETSCLTEPQLKHLLKYYQKEKISLTLCFDNPFVTEEQLNDEYGWELARELVNADSLGINRFAVANDALAERLRVQFPKVRIVSHPNRVIADRKKRTAQMYRQLLQVFDFVAIHPADGHKSSLMQELSDCKDRLIITVNDPCLRTCPVRYDHLKILAQARLNPFAKAPLRQADALVARTKCQCVDALSKGQSCNLSHAQMRVLYEMGYRCFAVQSQRFKSPFSLISDLFSVMFTDHPKYSQKVSLLYTNYVMGLNTQKRAPRSGFKTINLSID